MKKEEKNQSGKIQKTPLFRIDKIIAFLSWLVGIIVSLSVGAGMATGVLNLKIIFIPQIVTILTGWVVIILTVLSIIFKFFE